MADPQPEDDWLHMPPPMLGSVQVLVEALPDDAPPGLWLPDDAGGWALTPIEPPRRRLGFL